MGAGLFLAIGKPFLPPKGPAWAILIIWVVSGSFGYVVDKVREASHTRACQEAVPHMTLRHECSYTRLYCTVGTAARL